MIALNAKRTGALLQSEPSNHLRWHAVALGLALALSCMSTSLAGSGDIDARMNEVKGLGDEAAGAGGLEVTALDWFVWQQIDPKDSHLMVWVNVTNPGAGPATNLTAQMRGAETAIVFSAGGEGFQGSVSKGGSSSTTFSVIPRTKATVSAQISSNAPLGALGLEVLSPTGKTFAAPSTASSASVAIGLEDVNAGVFGEWTATVSHAGGVRGFSYSLWVSSDFTDAFENVSLAELPPGETYQFYFNIWANEPYPTLPPELTITINGTVPEGAGGRPVSYLVRATGPATEVPLTSTGGGGGNPEVAIAVGVAVIVGASFIMVRTGMWTRLRARMGATAPGGEPPTTPPPG